MLADVQWRTLPSLRADDLKREVFSIMQMASRAINTPDGGDDPAVLEVVPRLASLIESRDDLASFREAFAALARATGLFNYIDKDAADHVDALVAEAVTVPELGGITLHREQVAALNALLSGRNLILSAPTSFGKSILVDALLASGKYDRVAIVLPTIALLDEFRRRLRGRFGSEINVVMHPSDTASGPRTIFLGTQERLINRDDLGTLDLTVVDEFYKLDPARKDDRSITLNAAVYKLLNRSRQFFFLGPNIDHVHVSADARWRFEFLRTRFSTVAVDTYDLHGVADKEQRLMDEIADDANWSTLVFVSSPDRANKLAATAAKSIAVSDDTADFADWLRNNVGPDWALIRIVEYGFGVHHGRIPRAIASHMIRYFNSGKIPVLFCTSTLIEGVNTAAKSVIIYDKKINKADFDFFTFSNIKGRAGRLGQHYVGKVFVFNDPPEREQTDVAPTLFSDEDDAPDDYVVHLEESSHVVNDRVSAIQQALGLDRAGLRLASAVGLETAAKIREAVQRAIRNGWRLQWSGRPDYEDIQAVVSVICSVRAPREFGARSGNQLVFYMNKLRGSPTLRAFLLFYSSDYRGDDATQDNVFKFLRACEYGLPQYFSVVDAFVNSLGGKSDYSFFVAELSRWFRAEILRNLDEEGVPIQISERFYANGDTMPSLVRKLERAALDGGDLLSAFERDWVAAALGIAGQRQ